MMRFVRWNVQNFYLFALLFWIAVGLLVCWVLF